jgi:hypothetical protein
MITTETITGKVNIKQSVKILWFTMNRNMALNLVASHKVYLTTIPQLDVIIVVEFSLN